MIAKESKEKTLSMYKSMSDSQLISLFAAFKEDLKSASLRDDRVAIDFCENRMKLIEIAIYEHGKKIDE